MKTGGDMATTVLAGFAAGLTGTAAMSLSQRIEMSATGREPSATPAEAICHLLGFETHTQAQKQRLALAAHWAYGTTWGLAQSLLSRMPEPERSLLYFPAVWGAGVALLTGSKVAPPPTQWSTKSLLTDLGHHAIYTAGVSLTFHFLRRFARRA